MNRNNTEDLFTETSTTDDRFTYIDAFVTLRKDPAKAGEKAEPVRFRQEIVRTFCDTVLQQRTYEDGSRAQNISILPADSRYFDHQWYRYDPRQSTMMYAICVSFDERRRWADPKYRNYKQEVFENSATYFTNGSNSEEWDFIMNDHRKDKDDPTKLLNNLLDAWGLPDVWTLDDEESSARYPCDPKKDMNRCNFSSRTTQLYQNIMDELVTMRQAAIYGYRYYDPETNPSEQDVALDKAVEEFTMKYFMEGTNGLITCRDKSLHYLNAWEIASPTSQDPSNTTDTFVEWDKKHCYHPQTSKLLRDTIKDQHNLLKSLEYLDPSEFFSIDNVCDLEKPLLTRHRCALSSYQINSAPWNNDSQAFHNVLLNELMRYNLFTTYYLNNITTNNSLSSSMGIVSALNNARDEVSIFTYEQQLAAQAVTTTMRMLNNVQSTYPIHIGLQAYLEDIKWYRKQLAAVYTPMHQLSYLLRNVQECS